MPRRPGSIDVNQIDFSEAVSQNIIFSGSVKLANLGPKGNTLIIDTDGQVSGSDFITVDAENNRIGVFTRTPQEAFHIHGNNATLRLGNGTTSGEHSVKLELSEQANANGDMNYGFSVGYNGSSNDFEIRRYQNGTTGTNIMTINRSSDVATFSNDVRISNHLALNCDGTTDPTGTPPLLNHAHIYSKLTGGTAEIFVQDSDGNVTQISPHNPEGEWQYFSRNIRTGKVVKVNMEKMIRKLEEITGESFMEEWYEEPE